MQIASILAEGAGIYQSDLHHRKETQNGKKKRNRHHNRLKTK